MGIKVWMEEYRKQLETVVKERPKEYSYPVEKVPEVAARMESAFVGGTFNKDGHAIKNTCKVLGIKHNYASIKAFIGDAK